MVKNSHTLPLFGLGLILSTSPIVLLDSSLIGNSVVTKSPNDSTDPLPKIEGLDSEESKEVLTIGNGDDLDGSSISSNTEEKAVNGEDNTASEPTEDTTTEVTQTPIDSEVSLVTEETTQSTEVTEKVQTSELTTPKEPTPEKSISPTTSNTSEKDVSKANTKDSSKSPKSAPKNPSRASGSQKNSRSSGDSQGKGRDYRSRSKTDSQGVYLVTANDESQHYVYSYDEELTFALPSKHTEYQKVNEKNIKVSLFVNPVWSTTSKTADEYKELTEEEKQEFLQLFNGKSSDEKKRLRQILFSLSNRREWRYHIDGKNFTSTLETVIASGVTEEVKGKKKEGTELELKIKYFREFNKFKAYLEKRLTECIVATTGPCLATSSELEIIDQDKVSFFSESKKKK